MCIFLLLFLIISLLLPDNGKCRESLKRNNHTLQFKAIIQKMVKVSQNDVSILRPDRV